MDGSTGKAIERIRRAAAPEQQPPVSPAAPIPKSTRPERRQGERRDAQRSRRTTPSLTALIERELFPRRWPYLVLTMIGAIATGIIVSGSLPGEVPLVMLAFALLGAGLNRLVWSFVADRSLAVMGLGAALVVVVPLFLFGMAMTTWSRTGGIAWDVAVASLLGISSVAVVYLRRQPAMIFVAQFAIWAAMVVASASIVGVVAMVVGVAIAVAVTREQVLQQEREAEIRLKQARVATRAQDILTDYEQTGQGWFWETDRRSLLTYISPPVAEALRIKPDRLRGQPLTRLFDLADTGEEGERTLMFHLSARSSFTELSVRAAIPYEERWWSISGRPLYDHFDNFIGFRGSGTDLTERKRSEESANRLARYDSLTGLVNRFTMSQTLEKILSAPQEANRCCTVFLLDLDRFKQVNDTMGHPAGDALLKQVAQRLARAVGKQGKVGRLGGDEFEVILPDRIPRDKLAELGRDIIASLSQPYTIEGQRVIIGASLGVAIAPDDGQTSEAIIRNADLALYAAKDGGRGRFHFYSEDLHAEAEARSQMEEDLRVALSQGQMEIHYQPVVSTSTEQISGFEALMRWQHPVKGWISPQRFIESAEDTGMIQQLGEWALREACEQAAKWPRDMSVAVNVSPLQFANPQFPSVVANALAHGGIRPSQLELELTETVFLQEGKSTDAMFTALKKLGVRLSLDDFGTGYSSLGYLKKAPFDKIKIDKSFVRGITEKGSRNAAIIASITSLAHSLNMETTAEGVETMDELDLVRLHGCSHVQGYIYERPLTAEQVMERLAAGLGAVARGPRCSRAPRQTMLRKVVLDYDGHLYNGTIRNISVSGAMIEGLWNVPVDTVFKVHLSRSHVVACTTRWSQEDCMGVEFADPLQRDSNGMIAAIQHAPPTPYKPADLKKAG
ncbi:EAL domain-containing protein [Aurantiacibacter poecillastricola]|uniref:EAL domain-containing protein n=1 Tax=Aurantiacibacter poecillastricola TaxID=3064385 RepID=UPI00273DC493|nr:EAL domain-containing protein [Aurantiacibacter sp. 219JJ12-13]MDP5261798.1 EAL domain-containing protein [Aurantiacibacter sp. 219JJ12-13]